MAQRTKSDLPRVQALVDTTKTTLNRLCRLIPQVPRLRSREVPWCRRLHLGSLLVPCRAFLVSLSQELRSLPAGRISTQLHSPATQTSPVTDDPAVLAAVLYANSAFGGGTSSGPVGRDHGSGSTERPSSSRQGLPHGSQRGSQRHHAHNSSSARTGSNRNSCTRTQSTYSNTMTPISPATNASSFLAVDSGDEKRVVRGKCHAK
jgi:hypothetical protein